MTEDPSFPLAVGCRPPPGPRGCCGPLHLQVTTWMFTSSRQENLSLQTARMGPYVMWHNHGADVTFAIFRWLDASHSLCSFFMEAIIEGVTHWGFTLGFAHRTALLHGIKESHQFKIHHVLTSIFPCFTWETGWLQVSVLCCYVEGTFSKEPSQLEISRLENNNAFFGSILSIPPSTRALSWFFNTFPILTA